MTYNQNLNHLAELKFNNIHVNNNFKFITLAAYFGLMPLVLAVDFFLVNCIASNSRIYNFINQRTIQKYFFSGPMALYCLFVLPMGLSAVLELRFFTVQNEFQWYSMAVCCGLILVLALFQLTMWSVVISHYKHKKHPLVLKRFDFLFESLKRSANTFLSNAVMPLLATKRGVVAVLIALLYRYTVGPLIITAFI